MKRLKLIADTPSDSEDSSSEDAENAESKQEKARSGEVKISFDEDDQADWEAHIPGFK